MRTIRMFPVVLSLFILSASRAHAVDSGQGTVLVVNVNTSWRGLLAQLTLVSTGQVKTFETACSSTWAYMSVDDPLFRPTVAALLAARAAGNQVITIYTKGCVQGPLGTLPQIDSVDYGTRVGG